MLIAPKDQIEDENASFSQAIDRSSVGRCRQGISSHETPENPTELQDDDIIDDALCYERIANVEWNKGLGR
jgi:hypothetical protein